MVLKKAVQDILKLMGDGGEMVPITSVYDSQNIHLLTVVKVLKPRWFQRKNKYLPLQMHLNELLLDCDVTDFGGTSHKVFAEVEHELDVGGEMKCSGGMNIIEGQAQLQMSRSHSISTLKVVQESYPSHVILEELQKRKRNEERLRVLGLSSRTLGFVYNILKATNPLVLQHKNTGVGHMLLSFKIKLGASAYGALNQQLTLAAGTTLAYSVCELSWGSDKHKPPNWTHFGGDSSLDMDFDGLADISQDPAGAKTTVKKQLQVLGNMCRKAKKDVRDCVSKILKCPEALYYLDCILEEGCLDGSIPESIVKGPVEELLLTVGLLPAASPHPNDLLGPISLLVSAVTELDEEAVMFWCLSREDVQQLLPLVEDVLEQVSLGKEATQWSQQYSDGTWSKAQDMFLVYGLVLEKKGLNTKLETPKVPETIVLALYVMLFAQHHLLDV